MVSFALAPGIRFNDYLFTEPIPLKGWDPPPFAGLYVLLERDANWAPKPFQPLYFGEFGNATPPVEFFRPCAELAKGSRDHSFIALLPMPFSTTSQRWAVCYELVRAYHPLFKTETEPPANQIIYEWRKLPRHRIGFMPQTETA